MPRPRPLRDSRGPLSTRGISAEKLIGQHLHKWNIETDFLLHENLILLVFPETWAAISEGLPILASRIAALRKMGKRAGDPPIEATATMLAEFYTELLINLTERDDVLVGETPWWLE